MTGPAPRPAPKSIDETLDLLTGADYVADRSLATVLFLSLRMKRPGRLSSYRVTRRRSGLRMEGTPDPWGRCDAELIDMSHSCDRAA